MSYPWYPQAYYDETTVCGNCMEICRKLDSIRTSGFPDSSTGSTDASREDASLDPQRPSSEPLPAFVPATSEKERPSTAAAASNGVVTGSGDRDRRESDCVGSDILIDRDEVGPSKQTAASFASSIDVGVINSCVKSKSSLEAPAGGNGSASATLDIPEHGSDVQVMKTAHAGDDSAVSARRDKVRILPCWCEGTPWPLTGGREGHSWCCLLEP